MKPLSFSLLSDRITDVFVEVWGRIGRRTRDDLTLSLSVCGQLCLMLSPVDVQKGTSETTERNRAFLDAGSTERNRMRF